MSGPSPTYAEVAAARIRLAQLDIEIDHLKRTLESRLAEQSQCRQVLATYKYPILTLPAEITSEIFFHFLPWYWNFIPPIGWSSPPFLLQICRQWRDIALRTPVLWSSIRLELQDRSSESAHEQQLELLVSWLKRSGNCPLSIQLWDLRQRGMSTSTATVKFVDAMVCHASRWQRVDIRVPYENLRDFTAPMPLLRIADVGPSEVQLLPDATPSVTAPAIFPSAPNLREVSLYRQCNPFTITLPWSQITTLTAEAYIPEAFHILHQTTVLETCTLTICPQNDPLPSLPILSPLPLRSLTLYWGGGDPDDNSVQLVNALTLPALESLVVSEFLLGLEPISALSRLRPQGYPHKLRILDATVSSDVYEEAFPDAELCVDSLEEEEEESEDESEDESEGDSQSED